YHNKNNHHLMRVTLSDEIKVERDIENNHLPYGTMFESNIGQIRPSSNI
ncbi:unnamed protein product, partial [Didymodactylos carnosus]